MDWTFGDYVVAGFLLVGTGGALFAAFRAPANPAYKLAAATAALTAAFLFLATGAVGLIGSERNDANMLYLFVILIAVLGTLLARFESRGMAKAMGAAALAQALVPAIAFTTGLGVEEAIDWAEVWAVTAFFGALWGGAAALFLLAGPKAAEA